MTRSQGTVSVCILYILEQWSSAEDTHDETPVAGISGKIVNIFIKTKNSQKMMIIADKVNS